MNPPDASKSRDYSEWRTTRRASSEIVTPIEGGLPTVVGGKMIGGIGVTAAQDGQTAKAGVDALSKQRGASRDGIRTAALMFTITRRPIFGG
jgi:hypothetical protein